MTEEEQFRLRMKHAMELVAKIQKDHIFSKPLTDVELSLLHGPLNGVGSIGPRAHAEILRLREFIKAIGPL